MDGESTSDVENDGHRGYELECLEATRDKLAFFASSMRPGQIVRDVRLAGAHPDTAIVVAYLDEWTGKERTKDFPLWNELFEDSLGGREVPDVVAGVIYANVSEG
jgi:hypothetical protein